MLSALIQRHGLQRWPLVLVLVIAATPLLPGWAAEVDVTVKPTVKYQTIEAWSTADNFGRMGAGNNDALARQKIEEAVNDLGITANRIMTIPFEWEPCNDNGDPCTLDPKAIHPPAVEASAWNYAQIWKRNLYFKKCVEAAGDTCVLYDDGYQPMVPWLVYSPGEYAERVISYLQYVKATYGVTLNYYSIENEPGDNGTLYTAPVLGDIVKELGARLKAAGIPTRIEFSEFMTPLTGWNYIQALKGDDDVWANVGLLSYHLYSQTLDPHRSAIRDFGRAKGIPTAQTEGPGSYLTSNLLFDDLTHGGVSIWSLYGWGKFLPNRPGGNSFTHFDPIYWKVRQVLRYVRPGAVRVEAASSDPALRALAFVRKGKTTLVMINNAAAPMTAHLAGLPGGGYGVSQSVGDRVFEERGLQSVGAPGTLTLAIPAGTTLTVYPHPGVNQPPTITSRLATPDFVTLPASSAVLSASANDPELDPISYAWSAASQPAGAKAVMAAPDAASTAVKGLTVAGDYVFTVTVKDATHAVSRGVNFKVYSGNQSPSVYLQPSAFYWDPANVTLPATGIKLIANASDFENDPLTCQWTVVSQPAGAATTLASPTATTCQAGNLLVAGDYLFRIAVSDPTHTVNADQRVSVYPANLAPLISSAVATPANITLPVSAASLSAETSDPDAAAIAPWRPGGDVLTHWWVVKSAPAGVKPVLATPGARATAVTGLSVPGTYVFTLRVMDRTLMTTRDVSVAVNAAPGKP